ncbi:MAG TPA: ABC transporter permease, partial [Anaerolineales bacterium]|nr:ABC transporter permease [Anaerolineales bacterium]
MKTTSARPGVHASSGQGVGSRARGFLLNYGMIVAVGLLLVFFSVASPYFLSVSNFLDILRAVSILGIVAIGVTLTVVVNGFDASVGATTGLAVMLATSLMVIWRLQWYAAIPIAFGAGLVVGLLNTLLVVRLRIPDLLGTLGTLYLISGLQLALTGGDAVYRGMTDPWSAEHVLTRGQIQPEFLWLGQGRLFAFGSFEGVPVPVLILALVAVGFHIYLNHTRYGRLLYAVGGNAEAARLAGVNVDRYRAWAYLLSALL